MRGIAVVDVGYTNTKIALFSPQGELLAEKKAPSLHLAAPPYKHIDPEPMVALCRAALPELDAMLPIDAIVPTAHGAAMALLRRDPARLTKLVLIDTQCTADDDAGKARRKRASRSLST